MLRVARLVLVCSIAFSLGGVRAQDCASGTLIYHHDDFFEDWRYYYTWGDPPHGALGEAFALGAGVIESGVFWLASMNDFSVLADIYVWSGGVTGEPGEVLALIPGIDFVFTTHWPEEWWGVDDYELGVSVSGEFTIGLRAYNWPNEYPMCPADTTGPGGVSWICIPPDYPWPEGWQDPSIIGSTVQSLGFGVCFSPDYSSVPEEPGPGPGPGVSSWGQIKSIFR